jgi:hypothetical protein
MFPGRGPAGPRPGYLLGETGKYTMFVIWKRSGERTQVRFMPGCVLWSIVLSIALTILLNLLIRLF